MEQNKVNIFEIRKKIWSVLSFVIFTMIYFGLLIVYLIHRVVPFFPILFLFDFCFVVGYPMFLRYVLKKKWFECTKDEYLKIKYILLPWLIMELIVLLYYHKATLFIINTVMENSN